MQNKTSLPDVASHHASDIAYSLQWVGMDKIAVPLLIAADANNEPQPVSAKADIHVSLDDPNAKGIHMSRLYLALNKALANQALNLAKIESLLREVIESQSDISNSAQLILDFDLILKRKALLSGEGAFQDYPIQLCAKNINGVFTLELNLTIPYSSTCPCSASLSRQLQSEAIDELFPSDSINKEELLQWLQSKSGSVATPHSQRSYAYIKMQLADSHWPEISPLIDQIEAAIGTPVQTAVKREDEQEFARLNAENLMFCEDAARRVKNCLEQQGFLKDYWFKVEHQESLHAHNAVAMGQKF